ncbi:MAG TPA: glycosyltransferase, partial [Anaerolineaceae bacterium]|nr:glycosyltransferase [Anaerolineaceae bacterium]
EAFAHRTPVLASDLGGMSELVQDGKNGLLFKAGDAPDLAAQIQRCAREPGLLERLSAGIEPVRSVAEEIDELVGLYCDLAQQSETA